MKTKTQIRMLRLMHNRENDSNTAHLDDDIGHFDDNSVIVPITYL